MKSEQEIREKIGRLEQLREKHDRNGDYASKLNVSTSIRLLEWVLNDDTHDSTNTMGPLPEEMTDVDLVGDTRD